MKYVVDMESTETPPFQGGAGVVIEKKNNLVRLRKNRIDLRNRSTPAEKRLWSFLQNSKFESKKFRRQHSFSSYILDFYCPKEKLGIELDGDSHFTNCGKYYDKQRDNYLKSEGIIVLRFTNAEVFESIDYVLQTIKMNLKK
jgi:very-short-patch-repair endonuclease